MHDGSATDTKEILHATELLHDIHRPTRLAVFCVNAMQLPFHAKDIHDPRIHNWSAPRAAIVCVQIFVLAAISVSPNDCACVRVKTAKTCVGSFSIKDKTSIRLNRTCCISGSTRYLPEHRKTTAELVDIKPRFGRPSVSTRTQERWPVMALLMAVGRLRVDWAEHQ